MKHPIELPNSSKNNTVAREIARYLLAVPTGGRIPTVQEFQSRLGAGSGTVQRALKDLEVTGALLLKARQRQGSFVEFKDVGALWKIAGFETLAGGLPLPNSREFQGIATGLRAELERIGVPFTFLYAHGSSTRLAALNSGRVDFALLSQAAAELASQEDTQLQIVLELGSGTYYADNSVVVISRRGLTDLTPNLRIGIDRSSYDHSQLSLAEFGHGNFVDVSYVFLPHAVHTGLIDCAIWHRTAMGLSLEHQELLVHALRRQETIDVARRLSAACIVARRENDGLAGVLSELNATAIREVQQKVVDLKVLPMY